MKKWKKSLALLLAAVMLLGLLAACTDDSADNSTGTPEDTSSPEVSDTPDMPSGDYPITPEELGSGNVLWSEEKTADGWMKVTNEGGPVLGYSPDSGVKLIQVEGLAFKDLNRNGMLDVYEDWRLDAQIRAEDLADQMDVDSQLGLMFVGTYPNNAKTDEIASDMKTYLDKGGRGQSAPNSWPSVEAAVDYTNLHQAYVEALPFGIPMDLHSESGSNIISQWGTNPSLSATFDPEIVAAYARAMSEEYRALGITTTLTPQIDILTDPRWSRAWQEFGEDPALVRDMAVAYVNGLQSTYSDSGEDLGWGVDSVNTEMKHFPGDGPGEGGRESHGFFGAYAVYPGDNLYTHLIPFQACLELPGKTGAASGVMPSYSVGIGSDGKPLGGEAVGSGYSHYKLTELLREEMGFEGVISSDFGISTRQCWGVEDLSIPERRLLAIEAGMDQFGGESDIDSLKEAYDLGVEQYGEDYMKDRINGSAVRILKNMFQVGLFEKPYVEKAVALEVVNSADKAAAGYEALQKSVVMVKNSDNIIHAASSETEKPTVYIPMIYSSGSWSLPVDVQTAYEFFNVVTDKVSDTLTGPEGKDGKPTASEDDIIRASAEELAACDFALVRIRNPINIGGGLGRGYDAEKEEYIPITLQYSPYTATSSSIRQTTLGGRTVEVTIDSPYGAQTVYDKENRSYFGKTGGIENATDLDAVLYATEHIDKVIVSINMKNPMVFSEFEDKVDAILIDFMGTMSGSVTDTTITRTVCEIITGQYEPSGLLPMQMPANMETVEAQLEDVPRDMECHVDSDGNAYDFAFGLNWSGIISDERTAKYDVPPLEG